MIGELILRCFHARTNAHIIHLGVRSYAKHVALNEFYDGLIPLVDSVSEGYQGEHGLIDFTTKVRYTHEADATKLVQGLKEWIETNRYDAIEAEDTFLHNEIDSIVMLCATTLYKLKHLA